MKIRAAAVSLVFVFVVIGLVFVMRPRAAPAPRLPVTNTAADLINAVTAKDNAEVIRLLEAGADPNVSMRVSMAQDTTSDISLYEEGEFVTASLLMGAVSTGDAANVHALIQHGADVNAQTKTGETALLWAVCVSNAAMARNLLAAGADVNHQEGKAGDTALIRAVDRYNVFWTDKPEIVRAILEHHPNLEIKGAGHWTALRAAERWKMTSLARWLRRAGAKEYSVFPPVVRRKAEYCVTDLGAGRANALNNRGEVVGFDPSGKTDSDGQEIGRAFLWRRGHRQYLRSLRGPSCVANGINDLSQVVGEAQCRPGNTIRHAVLWEKGRVTDIHPRIKKLRRYRDLPSAAIGINNKGQVAEELNSLFYLWRRGGGPADNNAPFIARDQSWDTASPVGINDRTQIALFLQSSGTEVAGLWDRGSLQVLTPPGKSSNGFPVNWYYPHGINDWGQIVGDHQGQPVLWSGKHCQRLTSLYALGAYANAINDRGEIVGAVGEDLGFAAPERHAVRWHHGKVQDLNALVMGTGWLLENADAINAKGQIVGWGWYHGCTHAFLLTPLSQP